MYQKAAIETHKGKIIKALRNFTLIFKTKQICVVVKNTSFNIFRFETEKLLELCLLTFSREFVVKKSNQKTSLALGVTPKSKCHWRRNNCKNSLDWPVGITSC